MIEEVADVVIVGAGPCGLAAARQLVRRQGGRSVVVLDDGRRGWAAAPGLALWQPEPFASLPRALLSALHRCAVESSEELRQEGRAAGEPIRRNALWLIPDERRKDAMIEAAGHLARVGIARRWLGDAELREHLVTRAVFAGAVLDEVGGAFDVEAWMSTVRAELEEAGVAFRDGEKVRGWAVGAPNRVSTDGGVWWAPRLLLAGARTATPPRPWPYAVAVTQPYPSAWWGMNGLAVGGWLVDGHDGAIAALGPSGRLTLATPAPASWRRLLGGGQASDVLETVAEAVPFLRGASVSPRPTWDRPSGAPGFAPLDLDGRAFAAWSTGAAGGIFPLIAGKILAELCDGVRSPWDAWPGFAVP